MDAANAQSTTHTVITINITSTQAKGIKNDGYKCQAVNCTFIPCMNKLIENIRKTRKYIIDLIKELSLEKINKVPHGFNNNIIWNVGHLVAAQQSICYLKGGLPPAIPEEFYSDFKPGTRPERFFQSDEEDQIKQLLLTSLDGLQKDYLANAFQNFAPWTNRYGITLNNIDDAIQYLQFHEGLHLGVIMSIRKFVQK